MWIKIEGDSDRKRVPETWPYTRSRTFRPSLVLAGMIPSLEPDAGRQLRPGTWGGLLLLLPSALSLPTETESAQTRPAMLRAPQRTGLLGKW